MSDELILARMIVIIQCRQRRFYGLLIGIQGGTEFGKARKFIPQLRVDKAQQNRRVFRQHSFLPYERDRDRGQERLILLLNVMDSPDPLHRSIHRNTAASQSQSSLVRA